jgi:hypothetical protein
VSGAPESASRRLTVALEVLSRRMLLLAALRGATAGVVLGTVGLVLAWALTTGGQGGATLHPLAFGSGGPMVGWMLPALFVGMAVAVSARLRARRTRGGAAVDAARLVEARVPGCRNLVLSAAEYLHPPRGMCGPPPVGIHLQVRNLVLEEAAEWVARHPPSRILPLARSAGALAGSVIAATLAGVLALGPLQPGAGAPPGGGEAAARDAGGPDGVVGATGIRVQVRILAPPYTGEPPRVVRDPEAIEVLRGSRLEVTVEVPAPSPVTHVGSRGPMEARGTLETLEGRHPLLEQGGGRLRGEVEVDGPGFLALDVEDGTRRHRRIMALEVVEDPVPRVRILEPGQDLYLPDGNRVLRLEVEATDDRALTSLDLVFTRVRGFGELFEFEEGRLPLRVVRHAPHHWTGSVDWDLGELDLLRGDVVVYRARARDGRPEASPGESETWTVEILGSGAAPAGGFAGHDEMNRYALSQQMVLVLTEELLARRDSLARDPLLEASRVLAAAQRRVRAEFVFMLGGELEEEHLHEEGGPEPDDHDHGHDPVHDHGHGPPSADPAIPSVQELHEEAHARVDADAAEGRLAQEGRIELARAIRAMSRAATHLNEGALEEALEAGTLALGHLQRAFSSSRYLLRALTEREELDPGRRLTGDRTGAVPHRRPLRLSEPDPVELELRRILAGLMALAVAPGTPSPGGVSSPGRLESAGAPPSPRSARPMGPAEWAAPLLALDPGSPRVRGLASRLVELEASWPGEGVPLPEAWRDGIHEVVVELGRHLRDRHRSHPGPVPVPGRSTLEGAWADALRGAPGQGGGS